jgi:hypothetical protein
MSLSKRLAFVGAALVILALAGCSVTRFVQVEPGTDISGIKPGAGRAEIEAVVGTPVREWTTGLQVRYCLYAYDAGSEPQYGDASTMLYLDVVSLGLAELFVAIDKSADPARRSVLEPRHNRGLLAVSYDAENRALGVFRNVGEFAVLPEDGRPR